MYEILNLALPFFGLILLGLLATRFFKHGEEGFAWLNTFIFWFALPSLIFLVVAAAPFERLVDWPFLTATTSATALCFSLAYIVCKYAFGSPALSAAIQACTGSYGNVGYMGLPLSVAFFGPEAAVPAALVFCFDCTLQFTLTPTLAALQHAKHEDAHWGDVSARVLKQVAFHPFIVATLLGAFASYAAWAPSGAVGTILEMLTKSAGPCALFALGATVGLREFSAADKALSALVLIKLVIQPAMAYLALSFVPGLEPLWLHVALMMAALPTASNAFILARHYSSFVEGSSSAVIVSTAISAVTIPFLIYLIRLGWI